MSPQRAIEYTDLMKKMKIKKETLKRAGIIAGGAAVAAAIVLLLLFGTKRCSHPAERSLLSEEEEMSAPNLMYGIEYENSTSSRRRSAADKPCRTSSTASA